MNPSLIMVDPEIMSGAPGFAGTRMPVRALFEHPEAAAKVDDFLAWFEGGDPGAGGYRAGARVRQPDSVQVGGGVEQIFGSKSWKDCG